MNKMNIKKLIISLVSSVMITSSAALADGHVRYSVTADNDIISIRVGVIFIITKFSNVV